MAAIVLGNRARQTATTTGLGTFTLGAVRTDIGCQSFVNAGLTNGEVIYYVAESSDFSQWEVGEGTFSTAGPTVSRVTIFDSSSGGSKVNFSTTPDVWVDAPKQSFQDFYIPSGHGIYDDAGNAQVLFTKTASSVNYLTVTNQSTGNPPSISAQGESGIGVKLLTQDGLGLTLGATDLANSTYGHRLNMGAHGYGLEIVNSASDQGPFIDQTSDIDFTFGFIGNMGFRPKNSAGSHVTFSAIDAWILDPTAGNELAGFAQYGAPNAAYSFTIADGVVIGDGVFGALSPGPGIGSIAIEQDIFMSDGKGIFSNDTSHPGLITFTSVPSAVNYLTVTNSTTAAVGNYPTISAAGADADIGLRFAVKGSPAFAVDAVGDVEAMRFDLGGANNPAVTFRNTATGSGGPMFIVWHDSASPAVGDTSYVVFNDNNTLGNAFNTSYFQSYLFDPTAGSEDGALVVVTVTGGTQAGQIGAFDGIVIGDSIYDPAAYPGVGSLAVENDIYLSTTKAIRDNNGGAKWLEFDRVATAVNYLTVTNAATSSGPVIGTAGSDSNVNLILTAKGSSVLNSRITASEASLRCQTVVGGLLDTCRTGTPANGDFIGGVGFLSDNQNIFWGELDGYAIDVVAGTAMYVIYTSLTSSSFWTGDLGAIIGTGDPFSTTYYVANAPGAGSLAVQNAVYLSEMSTPGTPATDTAALFLRDNGAGKSQLCIKFESGNVVELATDS